MGTQGIKSQSRKKGISVAKRLTKSNYKLARDCPTKLYYKKKKYPSTKDKDEFLNLLADGGYMVEWIAKLIHGDPDQDEVGFGRSTNQSFKESLELMKQEKFTLFEPTLKCAGLSARVDILKRDGDVFDLIEVKAKAWDSDENENGKAKGYSSLMQKKNKLVNKGWREKLEDVTFQVLVLERVLAEHFPEIEAPEIRAFLCMPDKAKTTPIDELYKLFEVKRWEPEKGKIQPVEVKFHGNREALRRDNFMATIPVDFAVKELRDEVKAEAEKFRQQLQPEIVRADPPLCAKCAKCEYRGATDDPSKDGFRQCWGELADVQPHMLDLTYLSKVGGEKNNLAKRLIAEGRVCLTDIRKEELVKVDGTPGLMSKKQWRQVKCTRENEYYFSDPELGEKLREWEKQGPLHFVDFEASKIVVPYHAGLRPYEQVAFQWSVHTVHEDGCVVHDEWINIDSAFPAFEFAESLRECLGDKGTCLMWTKFEETALENIREQMKRRNHEDPELAKWLEAIPERFVDMKKEVVWEHYYHPAMKGSGSIKDVVDAAWFHEPELQEEFPEYVAHDSVTGKLVGPYESLPPEIIDGQEVRIANGTDAILAYQNMMYGPGTHDAENKEAWEKLLLRYCKLDTAAMVMVYRHWMNLTTEK